MLFGWFKRRGNSPEVREKPPSPSELRGAYRRQRSRTFDLVVSVRMSTGEEYPGELLDVSVGGASARFTLAEDPGLKLGDVVEVAIRSRTREDFVRTPGRVVHTEPGGEQHWRYGFAFVSIGNLYSQLDEFYARFFNRRKSPRVLVPAEHRLTTHIMWGNHELSCQVHDLSTTGMCAAVPQDKASELEGIDRLRLRFRLPGVAEPLAGPATITNRHATLGRVLLGIEFDLEREEGLARHAEDLRAYVERRCAEIARWEAAIGNPGAA